MRTYVDQPGAGAHEAFDVTDRGLLLGDGVFDTALVQGGGRVFLFDSHKVRLSRDAHALDIHISEVRRDFEMRQVLAGPEDGVPRTVVTRGPAGRGTVGTGHTEPATVTRFFQLDAASANIFVQQGLQLLTPPMSEGAIASALRSWIVENCGRIGLTVRVVPVTLDCLRKADCIFLTNSLRLIAPVRKLDHMACHGGGPAELTALLQAELQRFRMQQAGSS